MFTVVICNKSIITDCTIKYRIHLKALLENNELSFCEWNTEGSTFDESLPQLHSLIDGKKEWRAIIVIDRELWGSEHSDRRNPYDFIGYEPFPKKFSDFNHISNFRSYSQQSITDALKNPLTKLSIWLCGSPIRTRPDVSYLQDFDVLNQDSDEYFKKLSELKISPEDVEIELSRVRKFDAISKQFEIDGELFNLPKSVTAICERNKDYELETNATLWKRHTEFDYTKFYIDNLYPDKLRYLLYDLPCKKQKRDETAYFNFLILILVTAANDIPDGALRANRVYNISIEVDADKADALRKRYNAKLWATLEKLDSLSKRLEDEKKVPLERTTVQKCFESDVKIPVKTDVVFEKKNLMAKYDGIGLSKDCPQDEYDYWDEQYHSISKLFLRYLREPRRAVKKAVTGAFKANSRIDDDRIARLNEFQIEDIKYRLYEEEQNMVDTATAHIYNTAAYTEQMDKADKRLKRNIGQRMTKKKTVIVGLIAIATYLFGFLSLIFSEINTQKSFSASLVITGITVSVFAVVGFLFLFVLRHRLINAFKHFNYVMSGIHGEIESSLAQFSKYLSHACNVMRQFSVLDRINDNKDERRQALCKHRFFIQESIKDINELFANYIVSDRTSVADVEPYDYDFLTANEYDYDLPYDDIIEDIEFLQTGNKISVPVDYLKAVRLNREELYD